MEKTAKAGCPWCVPGFQDIVRANEVLGKSSGGMLNGIGTKIVESLKVNLIV
jgi:hypothetical protein